MGDQTNEYTTNGEGTTTGDWNNDARLDILYELSPSADGNWPGKGIGWTSSDSGYIFNSDANEDQGLPGPFSIWENGEIAWGDCNGDGSFLT